MSDDRLKGVLSEINGRRINDLAAFVKDTTATPSKVPSTPVRGNNAVGSSAGGLFSSAKKKTVVPNKPIIFATAARDAMLWSQTVSETDLASVSQAERQRQEAIYELVRSEQTFGTMLNDLVRVYYTPLQQRSILSQIEFDLLFANLPAVDAAHKSFLKSLTARQSQSSIVHTIGDLLLAFVEQCRVYMKYTSNQHRMAAELVRLHASSSAVAKSFVTFLNGLTSTSSSLHHNIREDLTSPTTRLFQLALIFKSIAAKTPSDHADKPACVAAATAMDALLVEINEEKRSQENFDRIKFLQSAIDFDGNHVILARSTSARIARESQLSHVTIKDLKVRGRKEFTLFIVADSVVFFETSEGHSACAPGSGAGAVAATAAAITAVTTGSKPYRLFRPISQVDDVIAVDIPDSESIGAHLFELRVRRPSADLLVVQAASEEDKRAWLALLGGNNKAPATTPHKKPIQQAVPESVSRSTSAASTGSRDSAVSSSSSSSASGVIEAEAPPPAVELSDAQMGLAASEHSVLRSTVLVKVLRNGVWDRFGKGDFLLAHAPLPSGRTRLIFIRDEDTGRVNGFAAINAWLMAEMRIERVGDRGNTIALPVGDGVVGTYHVISRTKEMADSFYEAVAKWRHPYGIAKVEEEKEEEEEEEEESETDETDQESDDDMNDVTELEAEAASLRSDKVELEGQVEALRGEVEVLRADKAALMEALREAKEAAVEQEKRREYEQRTLRRIIERYQKQEEERSQVKAQDENVENVVAQE